MKRTIISPDEQITSQDITTNGVQTVEMVSNLVADVVGAPGHWSRITVSSPSGGSVATLSPGQIFVGDKLYDLDTATTFDLSPRLPVSPNDRVWVAILLRGQIVTDNAMVTRLIDVDTGATSVQSLPKTERHTVSLTDFVGLPSPTPFRPTVPSNECIAAWILLAPTGIVSIEMHQPHRLKTLYEIEARLAVVEVRIGEMESSIASIRTDLSAVAAAQRDGVRPDVFNQVVRDVAWLREEARVREIAPRAYRIDRALVPDAWDLEHSLWLARIDEGIRFNWASYVSNQLTLSNPANPLVTIRDAVMLPAYTDEVKLEVTGGTSVLNLSNTVHTVHTMVRREISRSAVEYGPPVTICSNQAGWDQYGDNLRAGQNLTVNGETFNVIGASADPRVAAWNATPESVGHKGFDVQTVSYSSWTEVYWEQVTEEFGLNGTFRGQTFTNEKAQILTGFRPRFTRLDTNGEPIHVVLMECGADGLPLLNRVIARATIPANQVTLGACALMHRPSLVEQGKRYSYGLLTKGNYEIAATEGNKYAQGSSWIVTDGAIAIPSATQDMEFALIGAKFSAVRTVVEFMPIDVSGGLSYLRILAAGWAPALTDIVWEFRRIGETVWRSFTAANASLLYGLPAQVFVRATLVGTTDIAPALVLDAVARLEAGRTRGDMRALLKNQEFGLSTASVRVDLNIDQWKAGEHAVSLKLIVGATTYTPVATTTSPDPKDAKKRLVSSLFSVPATTSAQAVVEGTKTGVDEWFGQDLMIHAL